MLVLVLGGLLLAVPFPLLYLYSYFIHDTRYTLSHTPTPLTGQ